MKTVNQKNIYKNRIINSKQKNHPLEITKYFLIDGWQKKKSFDVPL